MEAADTRLAVSVRCPPCPGPCRHYCFSQYTAVFRTRHTSIMDEFLLSDMELEDILQNLDCDGDTFCGPPLFDLPPPPRPPWLDSLPDCWNMEGSCDNMPVVTSLCSVQDIFKNIIIIIVSYNYSSPGRFTTSKVNILY